MDMAIANTPSPAHVRSGRTVRRTGPAAVAVTSAFAGGALLTQTVIVPGWQAMSPAAALRTFAVQGPVTGATVFPFEVASIVMLSVTAYSSLRSRRRGRLAWVLATVSMVATFLLLPIYFVHTNLALLDPSFPLQAVPAELTAWYRWDWARAGFGTVAAVLAGIALTRDRAGQQRAPRPDIYPHSGSET
jgi:hypothetical protein